MRNDSISRRTVLSRAAAASLSGSDLVILAGVGTGLATFSPKASAIEPISAFLIGAWLYDIFNPHGLTRSIIDVMASAGTRQKDSTDQSFHAMFDDDISFNFDSGRNFALKNGKVVNVAAKAYSGEIYARPEVRRRGEFNQMELKTMAMSETRGEYGALYPASLRVSLEGDRSALVSRYREEVRADPNLKRRPMPEPLYARRVLSMDTGKDYAMVVGKRESDNTAVVSFIDPRRV
jgi:hypothetical protein